MKEKDKILRHLLQMLGVFMWEGLHRALGHTRKKTDGRCKLVAFNWSELHVRLKVKFQMFICCGCVWFIIRGMKWRKKKSHTRTDRESEICVFIEDSVARGCFRVQPGNSHTLKQSVFGELNGIRIYSSWWAGEMKECLRKKEGGGVKRLLHHDRIILPLSAQACAHTHTHMKPRHTHTQH